MIDPFCLISSLFLFLFPIILHFADNPTNSTIVSIILYLVPTGTLNNHTVLVSDLQTTTQPANSPISAAPCNSSYLALIPWIKAVCIAIALATLLDSITKIVVATMSHFNAIRNQNAFVQRSPSIADSEHIGVILTRIQTSLDKLTKEVEDMKQVMQKINSQQASLMHKISIKQRAPVAPVAPQPIAPEVLYPVLPSTGYDMGF